MKNRPLQPPRFTIYPLMIFLFEKFLTDKAYLGYNWSIYNITYLNTTKTFYLIYSKNLPGKLYAKTVPDFWTLSLLTPLEMCFFIFLKNVSTVAFSVTTDNVPHF